MSYSDDSTHTFVFKLNAAGDLVWSSRYSFNAWSEAQAVVEGQGGEVIVAGTVLGGMGGIYWMRLSAEGNVIDVRRFGSPDNDAAGDMDSGLQMEDMRSQAIPIPV